MFKMRAQARTVVTLLCSTIVSIGHAHAQPDLVSRSIPVIVADGLRFKDMNRNGRLDPYEDWRLTAMLRARDLVSRMTIAEKVGAMMHGTAPSVGGSYGEGVAYDVAKARGVILDRNVTTMVTRLDVPPAEFARQNNRLQEVAEQGRLGIPVIVSTDPRNYYHITRGAGVATQGFSKWPEPLGFAAIGDVSLTRRFGKIAAGEYRAVGIQEALPPQADLATEPRWPRINQTFGEDVATVSSQVKAYIEGFQGGDTGLNTHSVVTVVKHWVGYGAAADGFDSHNSYGRYAVFPGGNLAEHVRAFQGAFDAQVAGVMPTYSILKDATIEGGKIEQVGAGYSHQLLTVSLRQRHGFKGMIVSDFAITDDCNTACRDGSKPGEPFGVSMAWGVESLSKSDRFVLGVNAGIDQFGGTEEVEPLLAAAAAGRVSEARLNESAYRVMLQKFELGLFETSIVDPDAAARTVGTPMVLDEARKVQARAMVLLKDDGKHGMARVGAKVYLRGVDPAVARARGLTVVSDPALADFAIVRTEAPFQKLHPGYMFGSEQHEGDLDFKSDGQEYRDLTGIAAKVPTMLFVYLDRPAILTNLREKMTRLIAEFGASDDAVLDVALDATQAKGRLPFELPSSMDAVRAQKSDLPHDSRAPLYPIHYRYRVADGKSR